MTYICLYTNVYRQIYYIYARDIFFYDVAKPQNNCQVHSVAEKFEQSDFQLQA
jgi:hypothetical protein